MRPDHAALSCRPFDGLINQAILAPVTRSLYGMRVRYPLAQDFAVSAGFLPGLRQAVSTPAAGQGLLWPATEAVLREKKVCQVYLPVHHEYPAAGMDLPTLLQQIVAPLFADMERHASLWQRVRGSHSTMESGGEPMPDESTQATRPIRGRWSKLFNWASEICRRCGPWCCRR